jgi:hypothetical protein
LKPLPPFSRFIFLHEFFTERTPQEIVGNTPSKTNIDRLTVTAFRSDGAIYFPWKDAASSNRCMPLFSRIIFLRDFFTEYAPQEKSATRRPKAQ